MIVGIDTVASDDGGHRGTGGGGGEEQGWIVGEEKYTVCTNCYVWWQIWECQVTGGAGRCMNVYGNDECNIFGNGDTDGTG